MIFYLTVLYISALINWYFSFHIYTLMFHWFCLFTVFILFIYIKAVTHLNPPDPYDFVENRLTSSSTPLIVVSSAFLFAAGIYLTMFSLHIGFLLPRILEGLMDGMISNTRRMITAITPLLANPELNNAALTEAHQYLTPYIRSYESIFFNLLLRMVNYLEASGYPNFGRLEELLEDFREIGNELLDLYREIETILGISIDESPISFLDQED